MKEGNRKDTTNKEKKRGLPVYDCVSMHGFVKVVFSEVK
jgi:hypothetical protein